MDIDHDKLVAERNAQYGEAYAITDTWIKENLELLAASPSPFSLIMIQNKLTRALASPLKQDHYDDIIGYAKLLLRELERQPADVPFPGDDLIEDVDLIEVEWVPPPIDDRSTFVKERFRFNDP